MKTKAFFGVVIWGMVLWLMLTASLDPWELIAGLLIVLFAAYAAAPVLAETRWVDVLINPVRWLGVLYYLCVLWVGIVKASVDVWLRAMGFKKPDVKPGVVKIEVPNQSVESMVLLANSITLTPGTITAKVDPEKRSMWIHWIFVEDSGWYEAIAGFLNKGVRRVLP